MFNNNIVSVIFLLITLLLSGVSAEYIEGIDTTDANGYCRDSSFTFKNGEITGTNIVKYFQTVIMDILITHMMR